MIGSVNTMLTMTNLQDLSGLAHSGQREALIILYKMANFGILETFVFLLYGNTVSEGSNISLEQLHSKRWTN